jgi:hypothetical protein
MDSRRTQRAGGRAVVVLQRLRYTVESPPARLGGDHVEALYEVTPSQDNWVHPTGR